ncbi:hypothetical protein [Legionella rowbothamii]|uniref:hypothetical protein n=1 Tax=Legionella rowbothamii TaxID=96229 RepID=UPI0010569D8D|nr:hypothetical protein [Legionella rowbothamii]
MAKIDKKIEIIDIEMYSLEARDLPSEEDLNSIVEKAQHINKVKNIQDKKILIILSSYTIAIKLWSIIEDINNN